MLYSFVQTSEYPIRFRKEMMLQMGFTISAEYSRELTQIPNWFIRDYMPSANGNFVKLYLYLIMVCQHGTDSDTLSVGTLADYLECTENDILRAMRYWKKEELLSFEEKDGEITAVVLLDKHTDVPAAASLENTGVDAASHREIVNVQEVHKLPPKQEYTPMQAEAFMKDIEINQTISQVEQLLGTTVSTTHLQMILYFMCDVGFSQDLILAMYRTALTKGKSSPKYIEAIGISWAKKGITTAEEAAGEASGFSGLYHVVTQSLGLQRSLAPAEREIIDQWTAFGFSDDIIKEACQRTVLQTGGTNLNYVTSILKEWHRQQVTSLADIEKCDESFQRRKKSSPEKKSTATKNQFQNFPQRNYSKEDYSTLEKQLLRSIQA